MTDSNVLNRILQTPNGDNEYEFGGTVSILDTATYNIGGVEVENLDTLAARLNGLDSVKEVANKSGSPMVAGALVYISGYDTTLDTDIVSLADADDATKKATLVLTEAIADNASGSAEAAAIVPSLNTNAFSAVGSLVYESPTAGEWTHTAPTAADDDKRVVGVVKVKSATIGEISFFPGMGGLEHAAVYLNNLVPGTAKASGALVVDASVDIAGINTIGATIGNIATLNSPIINSGADAVKGAINLFPPTTARGKAIYSCADQTGNTNVTHETDAMGQATVVHTGDVGLADAYIAQSTAQLLAAELDVLDGVTPGTVLASGAVVVDGSLHQDVVHTASLNLGATGATVAVTADAGELNLVDTALAGVVVPSKATIYDASGKIAVSSADVAATGTVIGDSAAMTAQKNVISGANGAAGVKLPVATVDAEVTVINNDASNNLLVYPVAGSQINALGAGVAFTVTAGQTATFVARSTTLWNVASATDTITGLNATATELNAQCDDSLNEESITGAGALTLTKRNSTLDLSGAGAVTLAACPATMIGKVKTIEMSTDNGDVTLSLTNVQGGTAGTTATWDDIGEQLILIGAKNGKWTVVKEFGVTLA